MKGRLQRRNRNKVRKTEILNFLWKTGRFILTGFLASFVVILIILVALFRSKYYFDKSVNSVIVYKDGISIIRFDPFLNESAILDVKGDLIVESSSGLGNYPLKNIYALSENERKGEEMFRKTIMKNFHLPIYNVVDCRNSILTNRSLANLAWTCPKGRDSGDILYLIYAKWRSGKNQTVSNLDDYRGVVVSSANGGSRQLSENIFEILELDFSQNMDISDIVNVSIITSPGVNPPNYFGDIIKILGGRLVEVTHENIDNTKTDNCKAIGGNKTFLKNVGKTFNCTADYYKDEADIKIYFTERYLSTF